MIRKLLAGSLLLCATLAHADTVQPPAGSYIRNQATPEQPRSAFNVSTGTVGRFSVSSLTSGMCVQATTGGRLVSASGACGTGGGGSFSTFISSLTWNLSLATTTLMYMNSAPYSMMRMAPTSAGGSNYDFFIGPRAGEGYQGSANGNTGVGGRVLFAAGPNTIANTAVGEGTMLYMGSGSGPAQGNVGMGRGACANMTAGANNICIGNQTLLGGIGTGYGFTGFPNRSDANIVSNIAIGPLAMSFNQQSTSSTAVGYQAGSYMADVAGTPTGIWYGGDLNSFYGYAANVSTVTKVSNLTIIGAYSTGGSTNAIVIGTNNSVPYGTNHAGIIGNGITNSNSGTFQIGGAFGSANAMTLTGSKASFSSATVANVTISTASEILIGGSAGTVGQVVKSNGAGSGVTWGTVGGTTDPMTISSGTVTNLSVGAVTASTINLSGFPTDTPLYVDPSGAINARAVRLPSDVTGTLAEEHGGTGETLFSDGQLLIGNSSTGGLNKTTLTAGTNVTISSGPGTITIAASGGGGGSGGGDSLGTHIATMTVTANYGLLTSTIVAGNASSTALGTGAWVTVNSSGSSTGIRVISNGVPSGGLQSKDGGALNIKMNNVSEGLVIYSSQTDTQSGSSFVLLKNDAPLYNDPILWIEDAGHESNPAIRIDSYAPDVEVVNESTDTAHGLGKWEPFAVPYQAARLQVASSRCWDNSSFTNLAYWEPLSKGGGLFLTPYDKDGCEAGAGYDTSDHAQSINFFEGDGGGNTVGIQGPQTVTASWTFRLPSTFSNGGQVLYQATSSSPRNWEFTVGGSTGNVLTYSGTTSAPYWSPPAGAPSGASYTHQYKNTGGSFTASELSEDITNGGVIVTSTGGIHLAEAAANGSSYVGWRSSDSLSGSTLYVMPEVDGSAGDVLTTAGGGAGGHATSWVTPTGTSGGGTRSVQYKNGSGFGGSAKVNITSNDDLQIQTTGQLRLFQGNDVSYVGFRAQDSGLTGSTVWQLPVTPGTTGQVLTNSGSGDTYKLFWNTPSAVAATAGLLLSTNSVSATYTATSTDTVVFANAPITGMTVNLPAASAASRQVIQVTKVDSSTGPVTIKAAGTDLLLGTTGLLVLNAKSQTDEFISDGISSWWPHGAGVQATPASILDPHGADHTSTVAMAASSDTVTCPVYIPVPVAVTGFRFNVVAGGGVGGVVNLLLYDSNSTLVVSSQTVVLAANGLTSATLATPVNIPPGQYHLGIQVNALTTTLSGRMASTGSYPLCNRKTSTDMTPPTSLFGSSNSRAPGISLLVAGGRQSE